MAHHPTTQQQEPAVGPAGPSGPRSAGARTPYARVGIPGGVLETARAVLLVLAVVASLWPGVTP